MIRQEYPALWEEGKALLKQTKLWKAVEESPAYEDIREDEDLVASEVHVRLTALSGTHMLHEATGSRSLSQKLRSWGKAYWKKVQKLVGRKEKRAVSMSLEDFVEAPLSDLASHRKFPQKNAR